MIKANMSLQAVHEGRMLKRIRKMLGVKKHALAAGLGMTREEICRLESQKLIEDDLLNKISRNFKPVDELCRESEEEVIVVFVEGAHLTAGGASNNESSLDVLEKVTELYQTMLKGVQKQVELLEKLLKEPEPVKVEPNEANE